ncbi:KdsC family phosphatase [Armatimonas rosea]|uniref:3-deoxy-D-manno-octulosonate 8-phosphate phosphatase (KDO 8-P phosphatase) n=1 Tax=Armatimonas rosea TaxID=685828 RepID=A0A7W9SQH3_ARMRO|nr:HAD hydrolase family protein [Armatimonas rosea]MBB6050333.1 3-deoxy-D-manno-octulosonate 8-phosphate phosphatase (KDO 8-P phosphatase) [Armatimonas rosea]
MNDDLTARLARIRLLALDVDGTLTDGGIYFGANGEELKRFHTQDGLGIVLARGVGLQVAWVTGRDSSIVWRRSQELATPRHLVMQGVKDKVKALEFLARETQVSLSEVAFMGDDLNDLPAMSEAEVALCPADAASHVLRAADWVASRRGGEGAVREAIELILTARGDYDRAVALYLEKLAPGQ